MKTYVCLLRGINVSGHNKIKMEELHKMYESLGFSNVETYIQSGNVIFACAEENVQALTKKIEKRIQQLFGLKVLVFMRTKEQFRHIATNNPFLHQQRDKIHVMFLSETPQDVLFAEIEKVKDRGEEFFILGTEVYLYCPNGYGRTKLSNNFFERKLKVPATTRNWKTITTLWTMISSR